MHLFNFYHAMLNHQLRRENPRQPAAEQMPLWRQSERPNNPASSVEHFVSVGEVYEARLDVSVRRGGPAEGRAEEESLVFGQAVVGGQNPLARIQIRLEDLHLASVGASKRRHLHLPPHHEQLPAPAT